MGITDLFRKKTSRDEFAVACMEMNKMVTRFLFSKYSGLFVYKNDLDKLLSITECKYLAFWILRRRLNDDILFDMYKINLKDSKLSLDELKEQLDIRYKIYDASFKELTDVTPEDNPSSKGMQIGRILINHIGNLQLLKKGIPIDEQDKDIKNIFLSFVCLMESIKMADEVVRTAKTKYRIEPFLREA